MDKNFKVGDRVLLKWDSIHYSIGWNGAMDNWNNKIVTLKRTINNIWRVSETDWVFHEKWLFPIEENSEIRKTSIMASDIPVLVQCREAPQPNLGLGLNGQPIYDNAKFDAQEEE